jgi:hypothetical protein
LIMPLLCMHMPRERSIFVHLVIKGLQGFSELLGG